MDRLSALPVVLSARLSAQGSRSRGCALWLLALVAGFLPACPAQTIVCFGDSLTYGYGGDPGRAYPDFLAKDLAADGYHVTILNQGIGGNTTTDGLARMPALLAAHPSIVILELGANDGLLTRPPADIARNLGSMIETLQAAHIQVVLAGIRMPNTIIHGPTDAYISQYDPLYPALAAKYNLTLIPSLLANVYGNLPLMSSDYIHPNSRGYERVAENVLPYLEPLLKKPTLHEALPRHGREQ